MKIGDSLKADGFSGSFIDGTNDFYHRLVFWPDWVVDSMVEFTTQVMDMASATRHFKLTDTFKVQGGYPHEVSKDRKEALSTQGIQRDYLSDNMGVDIPKIDIHKFVSLIERNGLNPIIFSTPSNQRYIRDVTIVDDKSHEKLSFVYVINRRAQVITGWAEAKHKGKFSLKMPKNILKSLSYITD